jgi:D-xylose 1-dehydrogenase (NADP+, D-xylono-1,5-lactone-forming)
MKTLRWGLLSTAHINRMLIPPLRASKQNQLAAVASRTQVQADIYAKEWKIPRAYGSYEALLADPEIDVIYNPLPNHLHADWTIKAAQAGKHVLCEKPLALSVAEVDAIDAAAQKAGVVVMEAFMYRHHPQTLKARELVTTGAIGQLLVIRGAFTFMLDKPQDVRWDPALGGGCVWDIGCYPVSYARYIAGAEPLEVFGWQVIGTSGVDEVFAGQLRFPGQVLAQFHASFRSPYYTVMELVGTTGTLRVPIPFQSSQEAVLQLLRGDNSEIIPTPGPDRYLLEVENLSAAILEGQSPRISLAHSRANVATLVALLQSAREGRPIGLS